MDVSSVTSSSAAATPTASPAMGKDQFLQLLVAQLSNQDPLNPMDDKEFVAQLAQFTGVEQQMDTNTALGNLQVSETALANAQITSLIGREVLVNGDGLQLSEGGEVPPVQLSLGGAAADVTVTIRDANGKVVRTIDEKNLGAGAQSLTWDGCGDDGQPLPAGSYTVSVTATDASGAAVSATTEMSGVVTGVSFSNGYAELLLGDQRVKPSDVIQVIGTESSDPATSTATDALSGGAGTGAPTSSFSP